MITDLIINNGKILHDDAYNFDFHQFISEKFLRLKIILPGIIVNSVRVIMEDKKVIIRAHVSKEYYDIFKTDQIQLTGKITEPIIEGPVRSRYDLGILTIDLALDKSSLIEQLK
jgi:HSP20 family molecular chaperone IbpA